MLLCPCRLTRHRTVQEPPSIRSKMTRLNGGHLEVLLGLLLYEAD
jgi:hypothetical protein